MRNSVLQRSFVSICLSFCVLLQLNAQGKQYRLLHIYPKNSEIKISGKPRSVGYEFSDAAIIEWSSSNQMIRTICINDKKQHSFTASSFKDRNEYNVSAYLLNNKMSSMSAGGRWTPMKGVVDKQRFPEKRAALVIGNANYTNDAISTLMNPLSDAEAVAKKLQSLGFDVWVGYDCKMDEFEGIVDDFKKAVEKYNYQVSLFYYTGHGIQADKIDYLLPVDIALSGRNSLNFAIGLADLLDNLSGTACKTNIVFLNCCRDTKLRWGMSPFAENGITQVPTHFAMLQSTRSGDTADDWVRSTDEHSPFTNAFLEIVGVPGKDLKDTFDDIRIAVLKKTNNRQHPIPQNQLIDPPTFYFCHSITSRPAQQQPTTGSIQISSTPSGATVYVDGKKDPKTTDCTIGNLSVGKHTVSVSLDGYMGQSKEVDVASNHTTTIDFKLDGSDGTLTVRTIPIGATVYLDGRALSVKSDVIVSSVKPGTHTVKCVLDGYQTITDNVIVKEGEGKEVEYKLSPSAQNGELTIRTTPSYAEVRIDGRIVNERTLLLKAGEHKVVVKCPGYVTDTRDINVTAGEKDSKFIHLRETVWSESLHTFGYHNGNPWEDFLEIGIGYNYLPFYPYGIGLSAGWGPLEFGWSIGTSSFNKQPDQFFVQEDGSLWLPDFCMSFTPGIKFKYLGLGIGLGYESGRSMGDEASLYPNIDINGDRFRIDARANIVYSPLKGTFVDTKNYFIITPTAYALIPFGFDYDFELYGGVGYTICPMKKERSGFSYVLGVRWNIGPVLF